MKDIVDALKRSGLMEIDDYIVYGEERVSLFSHRIKVSSPRIKIKKWQGNIHVYFSIYLDDHRNTSKVYASNFTIEEFAVFLDEYFQDVRIKGNAEEWIANNVKLFKSKNLILTSWDIM